MSIFSRVFKKKEEEDINAAPGADAAEQQAKDERPASAAIASESITAELTRIKAQLEAVAELRKAMNERFTQVAGQIGELRGMVLETGKGNFEVAIALALLLLALVFAVNWALTSIQQRRGG